MLARALLCCAALASGAAAQSAVKCNGCYAPMSPKTPKCTGLACFSPTIKIGGCWTIPMGVRSVSAISCDASGVKFYEYATKDCSGPVNTTATMAIGACANPAPGQAPAGVWATCECVSDGTRDAAPRSRGTLHVTDCTPAGSPFENIRIQAPSTLNPGETADIAINSDLRESMTAPRFTLSVHYLGLPVMNHDGSACGSSRIQLPLNMGEVTMDLLNCPAAPGPTAIDAQMHIALIPPGSVTTDIKAFDDNGQEALCIHAEVRS